MIFVQKARSGDQFRRHSQATGKQLACLEPLE
jgi:hypothetical protein